MPWAVRSAVFFCLVQADAFSVGDFDSGGGDHDVFLCVKCSVLQLCEMQRQGFANRFAYKTVMAEAIAGNVHVTNVQPSIFVVFAVAGFLFFVQLAVCLANEQVRFTRQLVVFRREQDRVHSRAVNLFSWFWFSDMNEKGDGWTQDWICKNQTCENAEKSEEGDLKFFHDEFPLKRM